MKYLRLKILKIIAYRRTTFLCGKLILTILGARIWSSSDIPAVSFFHRRDVRINKTRLATMTTTTLITAAASPLLGRLFFKPRVLQANAALISRSLSSTSPSSPSPQSSTQLLLQNLPTDVQIVEVGPRDGLQNESTLVSVQDKIEFIERLADAGCTYIEAGSFVSPSKIPSMANSVDVMHGLLLNHKQDDSPSTSSTFRQKYPATTLACLVPNLAGLEKAIECQADEVAIFASASEAFSHKVSTVEQLKITLHV